MNQTIVVTGGTKGIGKAIIERFAAQNFNIITCARNEYELIELQKDIGITYPQSSLRIFVADLSKKEDVLVFVSFIKSLNNPVDVLVNNVGVFESGQTHSEADGVLEKMMETNLYSAYYLSRGLIGGMIDNEKGHIFNMCSTASVMAYTNGGAYCISKFALYGFTKLLREELKTKGVKVTAILPGATFTPSWDGSDLPPSRLMPPQDVATAIWSAYCLSERTVIEEIILRPQLGDL